MTFNHFYKCIAFMCFGSCIDIYICIDAVQYIIKCIEMELIVSSGRRCIDMICRLVLWIVRDVDIRTIACKKIVAIVCLIVCKVRTSFPHLLHPV